MNRLLPLLLLGCGLQLDDLDQDGFPSDVDCNDLEFSVNPDADEIIADGVDQNCDGIDPELIVLGERHTCGIRAGEIACEGDNELGQLEAPDGVGWTSLAAGSFHTCAMNELGRVRCWGDNRFGQSSPPNVVGATWMAASDWASLAEVDGTFVCWGLCAVTQ